MTSILQDITVGCVIGDIANVNDTTSDFKLLETTNSDEREEDKDEPNTQRWTDFRDQTLVTPTTA